MPRIYYVIFTKKNIIINFICNRSNKNLFSTKKGLHKIRNTHLKLRHEVDKIW